MDYLVNPRHHRGMQGNSQEFDEWQQQGQCQTGAAHEFAYASPSVLLKIGFRKKAQWLYKKYEKVTQIGTPWVSTGFGPFPKHICPGNFTLSGIKMFETHARTKIT